MADDHFAQGCIPFRGSVLESRRAEIRQYSRAGFLDFFDRKYFRRWHTPAKGDYVRLFG
jgi:hypothetical protein